MRFEHGEHFIHEEHIVLDLPEDSRARRSATGSSSSPGYAPTTVNLYDMYYVVEDDRIVDVWPILGRYGSATAGVGPPAAA